jgi:hypothetical protein
LWKTLNVIAREDIQHTMHHKFKKKNANAFKDIQDGQKWKSWKSTYLSNFLLHIIDENFRQ